jgi:hypothetical protein
MTLIASTSAAVCNPANTTALTACSTAFTTCSQDVNQDKCDCITTRLTCANQIDCEAANAQVRSWKIGI